MILDNGCLLTEMQGEEEEEHMSTQLRIFFLLFEVACCHMCCIDSKNKEKNRHCHKHEKNKPLVMAKKKRKEHRNLIMGTDKCV